MTKYQVFANGAVFGAYEADSEQEARDLCAQDAGYESEAEMVTRLEQPSELVADTIPSDPGENRLNVYDAIVGEDGSAAVDGWRDMTREQLIEQADGMASNFYETISDDDAARIADAVIERQGANNSCDADYIRSGLGA